MLTITDAAKIYIKKVITKRNGMGFRLSIKKTGCSGFAYAPTVITEESEKDEMIVCDGIKIFVDPLWAHLFVDVKVDYVEEQKAGLKQKRLVFINSHESGRCGCGESFHIE